MSGRWINMNVLIACEESQRICTEFRKRGFNAFSCDIQECSGGHPEWHIISDVLPLLNGHCEFITQDGLCVRIDRKWDLIIAHPPCTYLSTAATRAHSLKWYSNEEIIERTKKRIEAIKFFMNFLTCDCEHIAVENPQGIMSSIFRQPDQYIHPYYFAESIHDKENYYCKKTGLWLKNLPKLLVGDLPNPMDFADTWSNGKKKSWTECNNGSITRSKTFPGIAKAIAQQWGSYLLENNVRQVD